MPASGRSLVCLLGGREALEKVEAFRNDWHLLRAGSFGCSAVAEGQAGA